MTVVSDSSPVIALSRINKLDILKSLYESILIPPAVKKEILSDPLRKIPLDKLPWIKVKPLKQPLTVKILSANLGEGESQSLALTLELKANLLIIDDLAARDIAELLEIKYTGTLGVLIKAKRQQLIPSVKETINELIKKEFRISSQLFQTILDLTGEK